MGAFLDKPITAKEYEEGCVKLDGDVMAEFCAAGMQGWRQDMEDSHLVLDQSKLTNNCQGMVGVFDGHGGKEVALYVKEKFGQVFREAGEKVDASITDSSERLKSHLIETFHGLDDDLRKADAQVDLRRFKGGPQTDKSAEEIHAEIQRDLQQCRENAADGGKINVTEARSLMMKLMLLRKQNLENASSSTEPGMAFTDDDVSASAAASSGENGAVVAASPTHAATDADNVGCTAVVTVITPDKVVCANAGDSRAILCRAGQAVALSNDHKPNDPIERNRIYSAGGTVETMGPVQMQIYRVNGNLNLSRAVGDLTYKKDKTRPPAEQIICSTPDIMEEKRSAEDEFLLLACDGIWDVMTNQEAIDFIRERIITREEPMSLKQALTELLDRCLCPDAHTERPIPKGTDNMTALIMRLPPPGGAKV